MLYIFLFFIYFVSVGIIYRIADPIENDGLAILVALFWPLWIVCIVLGTFASLGIYVGSWLVNQLKGD